MSILTVEKILVALKAIVERNVNSHRWKDSGILKATAKKAADPLEKKIPNIADQHSHSVADPHVRWNNVIHCVADQQVKEMKAMNGSEIYGCLTVDRE